MENRRFEDRKEPEIVYSKSVKAGKRIYYLDVKKARNEDIAPQFEKHKLFLYKEDFARFTEGLREVIGYIEEQLGEFDTREVIEQNREAQRAEEEAKAAAPQAAAEESETEEKKKGLFNLFK